MVERIRTRLRGWAKGGGSVPPLPPTTVGVVLSPARVVLRCACADVHSSGCDMRAHTYARLLAHPQGRP